MPKLFLVYLWISKVFGRLWAHHQEKELCLCDTWCLLFCVRDCLVCRWHTRQSCTRNNKQQVSHKHSFFSWWWAHSRPKPVEIYKYTKNKLCTKLDLFTKEIIYMFNMFFNMFLICFFLDIEFVYYIIQSTQQNIKISTIFIATYLDSKESSSGHV